jgi:sigma-54 dependent transcriptional regulator, acetoin dehydrogenase operon transcriptional activator AcoR
MNEFATQDERPLAAGAEPLHGVVIVLGAGAALLERPRVQRIGASFEIGRGDAELGCGRWQIPDNVVSRQHARLAAGPGGWTVADLGSRNGTLVERVLLRDATLPLGAGTLFVVGGQVAVFQLYTEEQLRCIEADQAAPLAPVATASSELARLSQRLRVLAASDRPVLLCGETGTGKEVFARAVHVASGRPGPFVALNCAGVPRELFESELFGYRKGSHSQAHADNPGLVLSAQGGTLFLDEIGEMPQPLQAKLLRFLQDKSVLGLGFTQPRRADVRIVAATQNPFESLREDILGRLGAEPLLLPPLRRRREDIGALCVRFLASAGGAGVLGFEREAFVALCLHRWRRNVRELEAIVTEAALLAGHRGAPHIALGDLPAEVQSGLHAPGVRGERPPAAEDDDGEDDHPPAAAGEPATPRARRPRPSREELERVLREHRGDVPAAARALGRQRELVWRWCKAMGLDPHAFE